MAWLTAKHIPFSSTTHTGSAIRFDRTLKFSSFLFLFFSSIYQNLYFSDFFCFCIFIAKLHLLNIFCESHALGKPTWAVQFACVPDFCLQIFHEQIFKVPRSQTENPP